MSGRLSDLITQIEANPSAYSLDEGFVEDSAELIADAVLGWIAGEINNRGFCDEIAAGFEVYVIANAPGIAEGILERSGE